MINKNKDAQTLRKSIRFLYETSMGRCLLKILIRPSISRITGKFLDNKHSRFLVNRFIEKHQINMNEYQKKEFLSFNDFFTRRIKPCSRPVDLTPNHLISPCDAKLSVYPINENSILNIKNSWYSIEDLVQNQTLACDFVCGQCLVFRLDVTDYHRYCYIDSGWHSENIFIAGEFHSVKPIAIRRYPVFKRNSRSYTIMHSLNLGMFVQMEVGALLVSKITNEYEKCTFERGMEKGMFEFGGSSIILLFPKDIIRLNDTIISNSRNGVETVVKLGECIGTKLNHDK